MILNLPELIIEEGKPFMNCQLGREEYANILTQIVSRLYEGGVVAINGKWGTGKTTFVRMWKQSLENDGFKTLYFNVWQDDYISDPLIGLIAQMRNMCKTEDDNDRFSKLVDTASEILASAVPAIFKGLTSKCLGDTCAEAVYDSINNVVDGFKKEIENYQEQRNSVEGFCQLITKFVASFGSDKPVIFMVDELDRCNPSYAVKVLERIKHLFDIPNVVFVLSIDKVQLCNSIRGYYGTDAINAEEYLQRFINLEYQLPEPNPETFCKYLYRHYQYDTFFTNCNYPLLEEGRLFESLSSRLFKKMNLTLREMDRIYAHMRLVLLSYDKRQMFQPAVLLLLIYIKEIDLYFYNQIKKRKLSLQEFIDYFESNRFKDVFVFDNSNDHSARQSLLVLVELIYLYSSAGLESQQFKVLSDDGKSLAFDCKVLDKEKILKNAHLFTLSYNSMSHLFAHVELLTGLKE